MKNGVFFGRVIPDTDGMEFLDFQMMLELLRSNDANATYPYDFLFLGLMGETV